MLTTFQLSRSLAMEASQWLTVSNISGSQYEWKDSKLLFNEWNERRLPQLSWISSQSVTECQLDDKPCQFPLQLNGDLAHLQKFKHRLKIKTSSQNLDFELQILPDEFPSFEVTGRSSSQKDLVFSLSNGQVGFLVIASGEGQIRYFKKTSQAIHDFRPHWLGKKLYFSYQEARFSNAGVNSNGPRVVLDNNLQPLLTTTEWFDNHDFDLISPTEYWGTSYQKSSLGTGQCFIEQSVIHWKDHKKIFQISISELLKNQILYRFQRWVSFEKNPHCLDLFHLNAFQRLGPEDLLISLGNDSVLDWNMKKKKLEWALGGLNDQFELNPEHQSSLHHTPFFDSKSKTLLLFDNGLSKKKSRVLQYRLDLRDKKQTQVQILRDAGDFTRIMGSVEADSFPITDQVPFTVSYAGGRDEGVLIQEILASKEVLRFQSSSPAWYVTKVYRTLW